jgi:integrase/recombinase XerD
LLVIFAGHLARDKCLAASSISVAVAALRFLYTVTLRQAWTVRDEIPTCRQPHQLPEVLSPAEVAAFLDAMKSLKQRVILTVCYAAGLRVSEAVRLKPAAIDSKRMVIRVEAGKGRKDRYVMLSPRLLDILRDYWNRTRSGEWLFPGDRPGEPITRFAVEHACRDARERSGITRPVTPHSLRHYVASRTM